MLIIDIPTTASTVKQLHSALTGLCKTSHGKLIYFLPSLQTSAPFYIADGQTLSDEEIPPLLPY